MNSLIVKHLIFIWLGVLLSPSAAVFIFKPHFQSAVKEVVQAAIYDAKFINFIEGKNRVESVKLEYKFVSELLTVFRNIPAQNRTTFHNSEIIRLKERQQLLLAEMRIHFNNGE